MKTMVFWTRKRVRTPKMVGLATAPGSAPMIQDLAKAALAGDGKLAVVTAETAAAGRQRLGSSEPEALHLSKADGRVQAYGPEAVKALAGAVEAVSAWNSRLAAQGRVYESQTVALSDRPVHLHLALDVGEDLS